MKNGKGMDCKSRSRLPAWCLPWCLPVTSKSANKIGYSKIEAKQTQNKDCFSMIGHVLHLSLSFGNKICFNKKGPFFKDLINTLSP